MPGAAEGAWRCEVESLSRFQDWNARIAEFSQKRIFHESAWLRFLEVDQGGTAVVLRFTDPAGREKALWPGLLLRRGPIRIFGSPLRGWGTVSMGPLYHQADPDSLVSAAEVALSLAGVRHWEFVSETLPSAGAVSLGYRLESSDTHRIPLNRDEKEMWAHLQQRCRTATRKAIKNGLVCRAVTDGRFLGTLYRLVAQVFARRRTAPPYDLARLQRLWDLLHPMGKAFALEVRQGEEVAAAGLFISDGVQAFAWSEASDDRFKALGSNNLLYWEAMRHASGQGASFLHLPGAPGSAIGKFKASFNPEILRFPVWILDRSRLLRWGRRFYQELATAKGRWRYWLHETFRADGSRGRERS